MKIRKIIFYSLINSLLCLLFFIFLEKSFIREEIYIAIAVIVPVIVFVLGSIMNVQIFRGVALSKMLLFKAISLLTFFLGYLSLLIIWREIQLAFMTIDSENYGGAFMLVYSFFSYFIALILSFLLSGCIRIFIYLKSKLKKTN